ncbi:hypothetical protein DYB32_002378 [Aphanomyces invadans]|uniref:C2 domain-containing protein n=1 Tax=Aphanomyces invadans TaxID=157072 RepID=A0A418B3K0_9STRA|nr:hypothetical protein DYB32_002378 [Aphanomyces invadans]
MTKPRHPRKDAPAKRDQKVHSNIPRHLRVQVLCAKQVQLRGCVLPTRGLYVETKLRGVGSKHPAMTTSTRAPVLAEVLWDHQTYSFDVTEAEMYSRVLEFAIHEVNCFGHDSHVGSTTLPCAAAGWWSMGFFRRKKLDIRIPTGKDAVNWRKLLFLSIAESFNLLTTEQWSRVRNSGFDSDITFAVTRLGDVYVWGNKNGPTGLPRQKRRNRFDSAGAPKLNLFNLPSYKPHDASADNPTDAKGTPPERDAMDSSDESNDDDDDDDDGDAVSEDSHHADDDEAPTDDQLAMIIPAPVKLKSISGEDIVQIAVGRVHCAARTKCGDVFTWGQNDHCQLGNEPQHALSAAQSKRAKIKYGVDAMEPTIWSRTVSEKCIVKGVAVGTDHTMIISDDGDIHAFGSVYNTTDHSTLTRHLRKQRVQQVSHRCQLEPFSTLT